MIQSLRALALAMAIGSVAVLAGTALAADPVANITGNFGEIVTAVWAVATTVVTLASLITAGTKTPDPSTPLGKVYKLLELLAIVTDKVKQTGAPSTAASRAS